MKRDDLCISVPSFFRCPISLDVMESPVSLCTGVTYDRSSIKQWLDGGNNTCPATMQVLTTKELLPNCTLHRLIEVWSESIHRRRPVESPTNIALSQEEIDGIIEKLMAESDDGNRLGLMRKIVRFARESAGNIEFLAGKEDFVPMLLDPMTNMDSKSCTSVKLQLVQLAVKILSTIKSTIGGRERLSSLILNNRQNCLTAIVLAFQRGNVESRIESLGILESVAIDAESKVLIAHQNGFLAELMKSIKKGSDPSLIDASLSCLIVISTPKRVKLTLIRSKLVTDLTRLLTDPTNSNASITEKSLKLLAILSSCKEGGSEICGGDGDSCLQAVVRKTLKVSSVATEQAVTVLWSLCCVIKEERAREAVVKSNGVTRILLLLQSNCNAAVRHMLTDLLKVFNVSSRSCLSGYDTKTTHIMPF